jgi:hypothetical protein
MMILEAILAIALHGSGDYRGPVIAPSSATAVVCGASTVPVYDGASGAVVCESANTILGAQNSYYPVQANYGGYFGGYPQALAPWQSTSLLNVSLLGGFGNRFGGFGGFGGHHGGGTCTPVAPATSCHVR